jgi:sporulation protein YlmC with PRC-barrel domain
MSIKDAVTMLWAGLMALDTVSARTLVARENDRGSASKPAVSSPELSPAPDPGNTVRYREQSDLRTSGSNKLHGIPRSGLASSLVGMEVRMKDNEKAGDIKDIVVDLSSGRIQYLVLSTGGFLGIGDRLISIPLSVIQVPTDADYLVINADKEMLINAPSLADRNWPNPPGSNFEAYWTTDRNAVGAASAGVSVGSASARSDPGRDSLEADRRLRTESRYSRDSSLEEREDRGVFRGTITAINPETRMMTVEGEGGSRTFTFTDQPTLVIKSNRYPHLIDFKVGYPVAVGYHEEGGKCVAHSVIRRDAPGVR